MTDEAAQLQAVMVANERKSRPSCRKGAKKSGKNDPEDQPEAKSSPVDGANPDPVDSEAKAASDGARQPCHEREVWEISDGEDSIQTSQTPGCFSHARREHGTHTWCFK